MPHYISSSTTAMLPCTGTFPAGCTAKQLQQVMPFRRISFMTVKYKIRTAIHARLQIRHWTNSCSFAHENYLSIYCALQWSKQLWSCCSVVITLWLNTFHYSFQEKQLELQERLKQMTGALHKCYWFCFFKHSRNKPDKHANQFCSTV